MPRSKKAQRGRVLLFYLDECGFSPTQPTGRTWSWPGTRHVVRYEAPQGRRVNALAAYAPYNTPPQLRWVVHPRTLLTEDLLDFVVTLKARRQRCVVVLDNGPIHIARRFRDRLAGLRRRGIEFFYLPGYSPKLNEIEPIFGVVKYYEMPERSYVGLGDLLAAVERGFTRVAARLQK